MAIVHDLAESLVGDITPHDGVAEADKHRMEKVLRCCLFCDTTHLLASTTLLTEQQQQQLARATCSTNEWR